MSRWVACLGWLAAAGLAGAADWPQFLGPDRNGVSPETRVLQTWSKDGPPVLWQRDIGESFSGPVVAGGRLILFHREGDNEVVECLDAASGKGHWKFAYPCDYSDDYSKGDGPRSTPTVAGKHVYVLGAAGHLHCLELETGKEVWKRNVLEDYGARKGFFGVGTSPLVEGNLLLLNVGGKGAGVVAFDRITGKEVWRATDHAASYASPVVATVEGVRHVIFFTREGIVLLDPTTGAVRASKRWRSRIEASVNACSPVVSDGHVFVSSSYNTGAGLFRLSKDALEEVWSNDESLSIHYSPCVRRGDHLYGFDGRQEEGPRLRCVEWKSGKVRWNKEGFGCGSVVLADGHLIILTEDGDLVLVEATSEAYRETARARVLKGACRAQIALANGRLYGHDGRKLMCWNLKK